MQNKKVAIIFFGLTRVLSKTIDSIKRNLLNQLDKSSINYDIFIHTYKVFGPYKNEWTREITDNYYNEDIEKLLNPKYFIFDIQETIINNINFEDYYKKLGNWTGMTSELTKYLIKNMCLALYSKKQITTLFEEHKTEYDYAIIIRPEMELCNEINVNYFNELTDNNIIIPQMEWYHGCNDRFCIAKPNVILEYGKLFDELKSYSEKKSIISELYLLDKLNEKKISIIPKDIKYNMIRLYH